jgi:hypothetical protein
MKRYPEPRRARHPRVPAFVPVPGRARHDGWNPARQARFLATLAITRSVAAAARAAGMARESAYRLRARPDAESFAAAWDAVLGRQPGHRKVTPQERAARAAGHLIKPHIWRGRHVATTRQADDSALLGLLRRFDRSAPAHDEPLEWSQGLACALAVHEALPPLAGQPISKPARAASRARPEGPS